MKRLSIVSFFCFLFLASHAQDYRFKVFWRTKQIGKIQARQIASNNEFDHKIKTEIVMPVLGKRIVSSVESHYGNDGLDWSRAKYSMDGKLKEDSKTHRISQAYRISDEENKSSLLNSSHIPFSISCLYFREPKGQERIYSERHQAFLPMETQEPGVYKITLPDGNENLYHYKNGRLVKVDVEEGLFNVRFEASP